jgi:hypothetical protein
MGCDIHGIIERKTNGLWINAGDLQGQRNYWIFGILAGVRATGLPTIDQPRGIPGCQGVPFDNKNRSTPFLITDEKEKACLVYLTMVKMWGVDGHSHSFTLLEELKNVPLDDHQDDRFTIFHESGDQFQEIINQSPDSLTQWDMLIRELESKKQPGDSDTDIRIVYFFDN